MRDRWKILRSEFLRSQLNMKHKLFSIGSTASYMLIDFAIIAISIMVSYKFYRVMDFGQQVFYPKLGIIPSGLLFSLFSVYILFRWVHISMNRASLTWRK